MVAELITIGDEILIGQIIDTNSAWMAQRLNEIGVKVTQITSIEDDRDCILKALERAEKRADLVLITGGLGPTKDDITKETLADYFQSSFVFSDEVFENVKRLFEPRGIPVLGVNKQQANVPDNCEVLINENGTAPGMWFEKNDTVFVSMPGVPYEMKGLMSTYVLARVKERFNTPNILHRTILTQGMGEAQLAETISEWHESLDQYDIKLAFLPSPSRVRLRLSVYSNTNNEEILDSKVKELEQIIPQLIYGYGAQTLEEIIGEELKKRGQTVSTAESCSGGSIASKITKVSGSSEYYLGSVVSYANAVKQNVLGVNIRDLENYGAVSQQVVEQMALGVKEKLGTDFSIATSGVAGPTGGTKEKPVGTIWIAIGTPIGVVSKVFYFGDNRERNIERTVVTGLNMLRKQIVAQ